MEDAYPTRKTLKQPLETQDERWRLDPFAVMAYSPRRMCIIGRNYLPQGYMLNLVPRQLEIDGKSRIVPLPDRVLHPRWSKRGEGKGAWCALHHQALETLASGKGPHVPVLKSLTGEKHVAVPPLGDMVLAQLIERVEQELRLLRARITATPSSSGASEEELDQYAVLRPLSEAEAAEVRLGRAPAGSLIVIDTDLSPISQQARADPKIPMLQRPNAPELDAELVAEIEAEAARVPASASGEEAGEVTFSPSEKVYHGTVPLYPLHALLGVRAAEVRALLRNVLATQRAWARRSAPETELPPTKEAEAHYRDEERSLVAVQIPPKDGLESDLGVALAVALYRVALFRGHGWEVGSARDRTERRGKMAWEERPGA